MLYQCSDTVSLGAPTEEVQPSAPYQGLIIYMNNIEILLRLFSPMHVLRVSSILSAQVLHALIHVSPCFSFFPGGFLWISYLRRYIVHLCLSWRTANIPLCTCSPYWRTDSSLGLCTGPKSSKNSSLFSFQSLLF